MSEQLRTDQKHRKRQKTHDKRSSYRGHHSEEGICRVRIWEQAGEPPVIIVTELAENTNTSITNMCEYFPYKIIRSDFPQRLEEEDPAIWIEYYERSPDQQDRLGLEYALVEFEDYAPRPLDSTPKESSAGSSPTCEPGRCLIR